MGFQEFIFLLPHFASSHNVSLQNGVFKNEPFSSFSKPHFASSHVDMSFYVKWYYYFCTTQNSSIEENKTTVL